MIKRTKEFMLFPGVCKTFKKSPRAEWAKHCIEMYKKRGTEQFAQQMLGVPYQPKGVMKMARDQPREPCSPIASAIESLKEIKLKAEVIKRTAHVKTYEGLSEEEQRILKMSPSGFHVVLFREFLATKYDDEMGISDIDVEEFEEWLKLSL